MSTPNPVFPAAVATDAQLKVANNLIQTTLTIQLASTDTMIWVGSIAGFVPNCLVSIDKEIVAINSVVTTPAPALVVATGGRGFDGTAAAAHSAGTKVSLFIDAWHHNVLSAEVKAIEQFLGPNGQNIGAGSYFVISKSYDFAPQSPGGSLSAGSNVITLAPVPQGVNGTDQNHYLYLSGGTGAAEAVKITGGTAVAGAASGTIIVTCANAHSGAWTIGSATAGLNEAIVVTGGTGSAIWIPKGTHSMRAPIEIGGMHGLTIRGFGINATTLDIAHPTNDLFICSSQLNDFNLAEFSVTSSVVRTGGWIFHGNAPYNGNCYLCRSRFWHIDAKYQYNGFWLAQFNLSQITECWLTAFVGTGGIGIKAGQTVPVMASPPNQGAGLYITDTYLYANDFIGGVPNQLSYGMWIEDCDAIEVNHMEIGGTTTRNVHITSTGYRCSNHFFNEFVSDASGTGPGFYITGAASTFIQIDGSWFGSAGEITNTPNAASLMIDATSLGAIQVRNSIFQQSKGNAIRIDCPGRGAGVLIAGNVFMNNGTSGTSGYNDTIYVNTGINAPGPFITANQDAGNAGGGFSLRTTATSNLVRLGFNDFESGQAFGISPASGVILTGQTGAMGGSAMTAGQVVTSVTTIANVVPGHTVTATPGTYPGDGFTWRAYVSAANTVTTILQCIVAGTPTVSAYFLRVTN